MVFVPRIIWNEFEVEHLKHNPGVLAEIEAAAQPAILMARANAPHRTGLGAASIHTEVSFGDGGLPEVHASWSRERYYMRFHEEGTRRLPARPFLIPAFESYTRVERHR
jgi:HK97 gp10 family phage protein